MLVSPWYIFREPVNPLASPPLCAVFVNVSSCNAAGEDLVESFIGRVEAWSGDAAKRRALVVVGGNVLQDWLLKKAAAGAGAGNGGGNGLGGSPSPDQAAAENAICNLLSDGESYLVLCGISLLSVFGACRVEEPDVAETGGWSAF